MAYVYFNLNPLAKHTGDCVVRAIAFATKRTWDDVYWELCKKGFKRAEMPSWNSTWWDVLKDLNFRRYVIPDTCPSCYTVEDFCIDHPYGRYVLFIPYSSEQSGHVVAVENGNVYDTWDSTHEVPLVYWEKE
jgi:hypothetical protein